MNYLNYHDWQTLCSALETLHSDFDPQTLPERALAAASTVISADTVTFTGFGSDGEYAGLLWDTGTISPEEMEIFARYMYENPLVGAYVIERRPETLMVTDLIRREEYNKTTVYNEFYRRIGVESQLVAPLFISNELFMSCSINTGRPDFSERDKQALTLIAPHLANAIRNALAYQRLSAALDTEACGIVALNSKGKPIFISEYALKLFGKYFAAEKSAADRLPESLSDWIVKTSLSVKSNEFTAPTMPLKIVAQDGELTARLTFNKQTGERTLMLEEKRFASPELFARLNLTRRETEILFWITQGKTDETIARLCGISPRTVHKHVQNIYTKIGVETRTAAMLKALEAI